MVILFGIGGNSYLRAKMALMNAIERLINLSPRNHRTIQSCVVVIFSMCLIVWLLILHGNASTNTLATHAVDWAFGVLLGTVGIYHFSTVWINRFPDEKK